MRPYAGGTHQSSCTALIFFLISTKSFVNLAMCENRGRTASLLDAYIPEDSQKRAQSQPL